MYRIVEVPVVTTCIQLDDFRCFRVEDIVRISAFFDSEPSLRKDQLMPDSYELFDWLVAEGLLQPAVYIPDSYLCTIALSELCAMYAPRCALFTDFE